MITSPKPTWKRAGISRHPRQAKIDLPNDVRECAGPRVNLTNISTREIERD